jgi:hypothetical protein
VGSCRPDDRKDHDGGGDDDDSEIQDFDIVVGLELAAACSDRYTVNRTPWPLHGYLRYLYGRDGVATEV